MITNEGKVMFGEALAAGVGGFIAIGVSQTAPTADDVALGFEVIRVPVRTAEYDVAGGRVVYSATVPEHLGLKIGEVGLVSTASSSQSSGIVTSFDPSFEDWSTGTWVTDNVRVGSEGLRLSGQTSASFGALRESLLDVRAADTVQVAYHGAGGDVEVRLVNTDDDYFSFTFPAGTGYNVRSIPVRDLTAVGEPNISSTSGVVVIHSGTGSVTMDAIRVNSPGEAESLAVRQRFTQLYTKTEGMPLDIDIPVVIQL